MKHVIKQASFALAALLILAVMTPVLPTSVLIQQRDLYVDREGIATSIRTVTVPTEGHFTVEVEQDNRILIECNRELTTTFEARGLTPVEFPLTCELPNGDYKLVYCISAYMPLRLRLRSECMETDFTIGEPIYQQLQREVEELKQEVLK